MRAAGLVPPTRQRPKSHPQADKIAILQAEQNRKTAAISAARNAAGVKPRAAKPPNVRGICVDCEGPIYKSRDRCVRCAAIYRVKEDLKTYYERLDEDAKTQRALYQPISEEEAVAIATCESEEAGQRVMDGVIARETERIRSAWDEDEYLNRSGRMIHELQVAPVVFMPGGEKPPGNSHKRGAGASRSSQGQVPAKNHPWRVKVAGRW